jgi:hypothetical protein
MRRVGDMEKSAERSIECGAGGGEEIHVEGEWA